MNNHYPKSLGLMWPTDTLEDIGYLEKLNVFFLFFFWICSYVFKSLDWGNLSGYIPMKKALSPNPITHQQLVKKIACCLMPS